MVAVWASPAGFTSACLLAHRGVRVAALEASNIVGGISQTTRHRDCRFDMGGHRGFVTVFVWGWFLAFARNLVQTLCLPGVGMRAGVATLSAVRDHL